MDYDKNTIIAFVLIFIVLIGYWMFFAPNVEKQIPTESTSLEKTKDTKTDSSNQSLVAYNKKAHTSTNDTSLIINENPNNEIFVKEESKQATIVVDNSNFRAQINSQGAVISSWKLKNFARPGSIKDAGKINENDWVELIAPNKNINQFFSKENRTNFEGYNFGNLALSLPMFDHGKDTGLLIFANSSKKDTLHLSESNPVDSLVFTLKLTNGGYIQKVYLFYYQKYHFDLKIKLRDINQFLNQSYYTLEWKSGLSPTEDNIKDDMSYSKGFISSGKDVKKIDVEDDDKEPSTITGKINWIGTSTKYFGVSISPLFTDKEEYSLIDAIVEGREVISTPTNENHWKKFHVGLKIPLYSKRKVHINFKFTLDLWITLF